MRKTNVFDQVAAVVLLAFVAGIAAPARAQLTRDNPLAAAARANLDAQLRVGREIQGTRWTEQQFRNYFLSQIRNPFQLLLQQADSLRINDAQADSISWINRQFVIRSDSAWTAAARYLATLPAQYDLNDAWNHVAPAYARVVQILLPLASAVDGLLTPQQRATLPPRLTAALTPNCIRALDPNAASGARIGGAGALGNGQVSIPGCPR
jgi:hypothetical protein